MMTAMSVNAQNGYDDTKHEVAISLGVWSNSEIIDAFENVGGALVGARFENEKFTGPISAEYFYHVKNWLGVGGILAYGQCEQDVYFVGKKDGVSKNTYLTLMPAMKLDWLRKKHFGMYSKLAFGATLRNEKYDIAAWHGVRRPHHPWFPGAGHWRAGHRPCRSALQVLIMVAVTMMDRSYPGNTQLYLVFSSIYTIFAGVSI